MRVSQWMWEGSEILGLQELQELQNKSISVLELMQEQHLSKDEQRSVGSTIV